MDGRTDRQTDRIAISISRVSVMTRDKNYKYLYFSVSWVPVSIQIMQRMKAAVGTKKTVVVAKTPSTHTNDIQ